jgi:PRTRC genetic system protein B
MNALTENFGELFIPQSALLIYSRKSNYGQEVYVEAYDIGKAGNPINAHPLTVKESSQLSKALDISGETSRNYLKPKGLLPKNVLYISPESNGFVVWHTPPQQVNLFFSNGLNIADGLYPLPSLIWKAGKDKLYIYAVADGKEMALESLLYRAPFFNIHENGLVCMGNVDININEDSCLESFMEEWHRYFFNSRFSHLIGNESPVKGNIVQLYQSLADTNKKFPQKNLLKSGLTLKNLIR